MSKLCEFHKRKTTVLSQLKHPDKSCFSSWMCRFFFFNNLICFMLSIIFLTIMLIKLMSEKKTAQGPDKSNDSNDTNI